MLRFLIIIRFWRYSNKSWRDFLKSLGASAPGKMNTLLVVIGEDAEGMQNYDNLVILKYILMKIYLTYSSDSVYLTSLIAVTQMVDVQNWDNSNMSLSMGNGMMAEKRAINHTIFNFCCGIRYMLVLNLENQPSLVSFSISFTPILIFTWGQRGRNVRWIAISIWRFWGVQNFWHQYMRDWMEQTTLENATDPLPPCYTTSLSSIFMVIDLSGALHIPSQYSSEIN